MFVTDGMSDRDRRLRFFSQTNMILRLCVMFDKVLLWKLISARPYHMLNEKGKTTIGGKIMEA